MSNIRIKLTLFLFIVVYVNISSAYVTEYQFDQNTGMDEQNKFVAGQVWSYETRQYEQKSKLTILKVDYFEDAVVVHIRLDNIKLIDSNAPQGIRTTVSHMAFLQSALQQSVIKLLNKNSRLPEFSREYQSWRKGDGVGSAWAWHFSVSEALNGLERIVKELKSSSVNNSQSIKN